MNAEPAWPAEPFPWHTSQWQDLQRAVAGEGFPHAWLITGAVGLGKYRLLQALAKLLLCHEPIADQACGSCKACALVEAGSHSDLLNVKPEGDSRIIKVDQVRSLISFAQKTAHLGRRKVVILSPAEAMNSSSANALLKSLEEPAPETHLLLLSHRVSALPATLRSRCQRLLVPMPVQACCRDWLTLQTGDADLSCQLLKAASGAPLVAMELFRTGSLDAHNGLLKTLQALAEGSLNAVDFPGLVDSLELDYVLGSVIAFLQQLIRDASLAGGGVNLQACFQVLDKLLGIRQAVASGANPNRQLMLEDIAVRMRGVLGASDGR